jgi:hypothetical protein
MKGNPFVLFKSRLYCGDEFGVVVAIEIYRWCETSDGLVQYSAAYLEHCRRNHVEQGHMSLRRVILSKSGLRQRMAATSSGSTQVG